MRGDHGQPVVVAVGSDTNGQALDWAAAEASARRCRLHVVHAERLRWAVDPSGLVPVVDDVSYRVTADELLRRAVSRARSVDPDIDVSAESVFGPAFPLLVSRAHGAQLLVLGSRDPPSTRALPRHLVPSLPAAVARRAPCPVAIVRPLPSRPCAGSTPTVVVGVDGPNTSAAALDVAFRAAAQRGVPVTAVHAWTPDAPADHEAVCCPSATAERRVRSIVDQVLEPWRKRFADVRVETRLLVARPSAALIRESEGAALIVVGSRAHGAARATLFGSVSRTVAQRARCPVVVVRTDGATAKKHGRPGRRTAVLLTEPTGPDPVPRRRTTWE
jgi:nucleotide-binding universal stress UspA family protein